MRSIEENNSTEQRVPILRPWYEQVQPRLMDGPVSRVFTTDRHYKLLPSPRAYSYAPTTDEVAGIFRL
jgi:hypothetical protein